MDSFAATNKILENLNIKYRYVDNMMNLTKDMERAMMANDSVAFGSILDMRGDVMILADGLDQDNKKIIDHLPSPLKERMASVLIPKFKTSGESLVLSNPLETNIYDTNKRIIALLTKVAKLDTEINQRISGQNKPQGLMNIRG